MTLKITADNIDLSTLTSVTGPKITLVDYPGDDLATLPAGGATVAIAGTGFVNGCQVLVDSTYANTVTFVSSTSITFTTPAMSAGTYPIYVINPDGGTAIAIPGISYSGVPAFATSSGSLGAQYETTTFSSNIVATSDSAIAYTIDSGALPAGLSLNANTGAITGNLGAVTNSTTYNFVVKATDAELQDTTRSFSIAVNPDVVTFNTPAGTPTYGNLTAEAFSLTLNATSALGKTITYTANTLPSGLSITGNLLSGTFNTVANTVSLITATAATTSKTATKLLTWAVAAPPPSTGQIAYTTAGTYSWTAPAGITSVCVVCVGGGGAGFSSATNSNQATGGGGGLGWKNDITVTPGQSYAVVVGAGGSQAGLNGATTNAGDSYFIAANNNAYATGKGGISATPGSGGTGGIYYGAGGGNGGNGSNNISNGNIGCGGGGAGGYSGNGANGRNSGGGPGFAAPAGSGAGGSGGTNGNGGGGVGIFGKGGDGSEWAGGGSGGDGGGFNGSSGAYGGGGSCHYNQFFASPAGGAVRIIWGPGRAFPSTLTTDQ